MTDHLPEIGVVAIGINVEKFLTECLQSIRDSDYPQNKLQIVFVDGGSTDNSVALAKQADGVRVIELKDPHPTPGKGRNAGWRRLQTPLIQFLDADTALHPQWLKTAVGALEENKVGAVCGQRREKFPDKNLYHQIANREWEYEMGPCRYFGGEVLIKRDILEKTDGFDAHLIAGEDPELSYRVRQSGETILRTADPMTTHDLDMTRFKQYFKRALRSGYAYAELGTKFVMNKEKLWARELLRVIFRSLAPIVFIIGGVCIDQVLAGLVLALLVFLRPFFQVSHFKRGGGVGDSFNWVYAGHLSLVPIFQFFGVARYYLGKLTSRPIRNYAYHQSIRGNV